MPRAIPDDNLAYPVLVELNSGSSGSGFFLNLADGTVLVTARHVLFERDGSALLAPKATLSCFSKEPAERIPNVFQLDLAGLRRAGHVKAHGTRDVAIVRVGYTAPESRVLNIVEGVTVASTAPSGVTGVAPSTTKRFEEVLVANDVVLFGYPMSLGLKEHPPT